MTTTTITTKQKSTTPRIQVEEKKVKIKGERIALRLCELQNSI